LTARDVRVCRAHQTERGERERHRQHRTRHGPDGEPIDPFENGTSQFVTVRWPLPTDVGNEIQSDSIRVCFDFYAEQSHRNTEERFRGTGGTPDDKYPENPWADEYALGAFVTLADRDVIFGPTPDNGNPDSSA
jgi:hypothetical protein